MDLAVNLQGCGKISHRVSNPEPSSPYRVAKSTTLPRPPPNLLGLKKKKTTQNFNLNTRFKDRCLNSGAMKHKTRIPITFNGI